MKRRNFLLAPLLALLPWKRGEAKASPLPPEMPKEAPPAEGMRFFRLTGYVEAELCEWNKDLQRFLPSREIVQLLDLPIRYQALEGWCKDGIIVSRELELR